MGSGDILTRAHGVAPIRCFRSGDVSTGDVCLAVFKRKGNNRFELSIAQQLSIVELPSEKMTREGFLPSKAIWGKPQQMDREYLYVFPYL